MDPADKTSRAYRVEVQMTSMNLREDNKTDITVDIYEN